MGKKAITTIRISKEAHAELVTVKGMLMSGKKMHVSLEQTILGGIACLKKKLPEKIC
jgi:hypothetical protein